MDHPKPGASRAAMTPRVHGARVLAAGLLAAGLAVLAGCSRQPVEETGHARVVHVEGQASVRKQGASVQQPAVAGMRLGAGDHVWVQSGVVRIEYDATLEVQEVRANTIVEIGEVRRTRPAGSS